MRVARRARADGENAPPPATVRGHAEDADASQRQGQRLQQALTSSAKRGNDRASLVARRPCRRESGTDGSTDASVARARCGMSTSAAVVVRMTVDTASQNLRGEREGHWRRCPAKAELVADVVDDADHGARRVTRRPSELHAPPDPPLHHAFDSPARPGARLRDQRDVPAAPSIRSASNSLSATRATSMSRSSGPTIALSEPGQLPEPPGRLLPLARLDPTDLRRRAAAGDGPNGDVVLVQAPPARWSTRSGRRAGGPDTPASSEIRLETEKRRSVAEPEDPRRSSACRLRTRQARAHQQRRGERDLRHRRARRARRVVGPSSQRRWPLGDAPRRTHSMRDGDDQRGREAAP